MQAVDDTDTPANAGEMVSKFKVESVKVDKNIVDMIAKSKAMISAIGGLTLSITDIATSAVNFSENETNDIEAFNEVRGSEGSERSDSERSDS